MRTATQGAQARADEGSRLTAARPVVPTQLRSADDPERILQPSGNLINEFEG